MYRPQKYRLYPFLDPERELLRPFEELRFRWHYALERRQEAGRKERRSLSYADQCRDLARWRAYDRDGIGRVYGHGAQETLARFHDPPLPLQNRPYECPCGLRLDRDRNAARNILGRARRAVPGGTGESTPVETGSPPHRKERRVRSEKREPPSALGGST